MIEEIKVPEIGENIESGKVVAVLVKAGDVIEVEDSVIEIETDKAVVEIPSQFSGTIMEVFARQGEELKVGAVIATIDTQQAANQDARAASNGDTGIAGEPAKTPETEAETPPMPAAAQQMSAERAPATDSSAPPEAELNLGMIAASPSIRRLARELGVDLRTLPGTGPGDRITEEDIKSHVKQCLTAAADQGARPAAVVPPLPDFGRWGPVETVELSTVRRLTARTTATAWHTVPHVTQFDEADISPVAPFLERNAQKVIDAGGKLTITAILLKICAQALRKFPIFNSSIDLVNNTLVYKQYIHIALAVDTQRGLLMPVVRDADQKNLTRLAVEISELAHRCRNKKIKPEELEGGTFGISNQGSIGGVGFTPIVPWPQVAILGISQSAIRPRYVDGGFQPRTILPLALSYDHRVIDGAGAARFLGWICECLAYPLTLDLE
jgi:pyruvate dehydrogenase E2 component (dihydrolipoamide acetyltransferase)